MTIRISINMIPNSTDVNRYQL